MLPKRILDQAKAFLCWDSFPDLTIKLVPLQEPVAFYYPPSPTYNTIVVFYPILCRDFSSPVFLLFHEIGHYLQFHEYRQQGREAIFWNLVNTIDGPQKIRFESDSWERGAVLFKKFLEQLGLFDRDLLKQYEHYAAQSITTYHHC